MVGVDDGRPARSQQIEVSIKVPSGSLTVHVVRKDGKTVRDSFTGGDVIHRLPGASRALAGGIEKRYRLITHMNVGLYKLARNRLGVEI